MRAFFLGFIFLICVGLFAGIGVLLFPLLLLLAFFLRILILCILVIMAIWALGKMIIFIWERMIK